MADGATHEMYRQKNTKYAMSLSAVFSVLLFSVNPILSVAFFPFSFVNWKITKYVTPDSDMAGLTIGEWTAISDFKERFGWFGGLLATIWNSWWMIYSYISGHHRSWYSHGWGIGTIGRMIHMNIPIAYVIFYNGWQVFIFYDKNIQMIFLSYLLSQFYTWFYADAIHLILDTEWAKGRLYKPKRSR